LSSRRVAYDAELDFCVQLAEFAPDLKISVSACQEPFGARREIMEDLGDFGVRSGITQDSD
jgi:hypothetical protein